MDLIKEAKKRGYKKGVAIKYVDHAIDFVEGDYFEVASNGNLLAYAKPEVLRKTFDDDRHDTLYDASEDKWVEIFTGDQAIFKSKM